MSVLVNEDSEFEKQGVQFKIITEDMYEAIKDFYWKHFIPDEPISRYTFKTACKSHIVLDLFFAIKI